MHCLLLLIMYIIMFKQNRRLFICAYTVAHFININPVYELKDMHVERENWKGLGCIFVVVTCDWQWQMALWPPALLRHYYRQRRTAADAMPPPKHRRRQHAKRQQWRSAGEHKSQKWIRERWQWYWNLIYITNLIRYAWHVQKPGKGYQHYSKYNVVVYVCTVRYGCREPFRNCFRFAWGHNSIQLRGNVSFPRERQRHDLYPCDGRQKNLSSILFSWKAG